MALGVKVFSTTKARDRASIGEVITRWLSENPDLRVLETKVTQSSDRQYHCFTITILYDRP